jgi:hypothetical protein
VQRHHGEVLALGAEVLVPLPFPAAADPSRQAYRAFGLERTSWRALLRPGILLGYLGLMLRGWRPRKPYPGEDVLQLGGDFVLDSEGRLLYAYRSADPTDRPAAADLLRALRTAGEHPGG